MTKGSKVGKKKCTGRSLSMDTDESGLDAGGNQKSAYKNDLMTKGTKGTTGTKGTKRRMRILTIGSKSTVTGRSVLSNFGTKQNKNVEAPMKKVTKGGKTNSTETQITRGAKGERERQ
jgi:hypothetical protein